LENDSPTKIDETNGTTMNLRLRITPSSTSSPEKSNDNTNSKINDDNDQEPVEKIEGVRHNTDGISFQIKMRGETNAHWVSAKLANRLYPQSVIAFWERHVEFM